MISRDPDKDAQITKRLAQLAQARTDLQQEIKELKAECLSLGHVVVDSDCKRIAQCSVCGEIVGSYCEVSPTKTCAYKEDEHFGDFCIYCGLSSAIDELNEELWDIGLNVNL